MAASSFSYWMNTEQHTLYRSEPLKQKSNFRVLCLDGGGMRGIIPATILAELEDLLIEQYEDPSIRLVDFFDFFAGISTGGILTCLYLMPDPKQPDRPRFSAREVLNLYCNEGKKIFYRSPKRRLTSMMGFAKEKFDSKQMTKMLKEFMQETRLKELIKPCIIPAYDIEEQCPFYFSGTEAKASLRADYPVWQVAQATASAPVYFGPTLVKAADGTTKPLIDAGVFAKNPALDCYHYLQQLFPETNTPITMLSMGTGCTSKSFQVEDFEAKGILHTWKPLLHILGNAKSRSTEKQIRTLLQQDRAGHQYYRLNPAISKKNSSMDDVSERQLKGLRRIGLDFAKTEQKLLQQIMYSL